MNERAALTKTTENKGKNPVAAKPKKKFYESMDSPVEEIFHLQQTMGNQAVQRLLKSGSIQAKLTIGKPNDKYEQEADRVADKVMNMPEQEGSLVNGHWSLVQRQVGPGEEGKEEPIQTKPIAGQISPLIQHQEDGFKADSILRWNKRRNRRRTKTDLKDLGLSKEDIKILMMLHFTTDNLGIYDYFDLVNHIGPYVAAIGDVTASMIFDVVKEVGSPPIPANELVTLMGAHTRGYEYIAELWQLKLSQKLNIQQVMLLASLDRSVGDIGELLLNLKGLATPLTVEEIKQLEGITNAEITQLAGLEQVATTDQLIDLVREAKGTTTSDIVELAGLEQVATTAQLIRLAQELAKGWTLSEIKGLLEDLKYRLESILGPPSVDQSINYSQESLNELYKYLKEVRNSLPTFEPEVKKLLEVYFPGYGEDVWEECKLADELSQLRSQLLDTEPGTPEHENARKYLGIIESEIKRRPRVIGELAEPPIPTATIILVGSPAGYDKSPYNFTNAALAVMSKIQDVLPGTSVTILFFSPGYKLRGENVYNKAKKDLNAADAKVIEVINADQAINYINIGLTSPTESIPTRAIKVSRFFYFGHGSPTEMLLNQGWGGVELHYIGIENISKDISMIKTEAFDPIGESYLFTCEIAAGANSFMSVWVSHLGQTSIGPQGKAAFNAKYEAHDLEKAINQKLPEWFLGLPYMNQVKIIDPKSTK